MVERVSAFACVVVPYFAAAAVERVEPGLRERPLAVVSGAPPATRVVDANDAARACGVHSVMTEADARTRCPALVSRTLAEDVGAAARHALLDAGLAVSPRVEDAGPGVVHVDTTGLERLVGDATAVGRRLLRETRAVGFTATVGLAESRAAARVAARLGPAITVVEPGRERETLAAAPLALLEPDAATTATLVRWGVRTLGALAALPRDGLAARLGAPGLRLHDLACGLDREPFRAYAPPPFYQEAQGVEWEIDTLDALATVLMLALDRLCARLAVSHLAADVLDVDLGLASGERHHRRVVLAHPLADAGAMLTLTRLDLEAHPPPAAVTAVAVTAHPVRALPGQNGLWTPTMPALRELATILTRLAALVGPAAVGAPTLIDSNRPDPIALTRFNPMPGATPPPSTVHAGISRPQRSFMILRRVRPPRAIDVEAGELPRAMRWNGVRYGVTACAGPWRSSGEWWDVDVWARDEWDVALADGTLCRVARDLRTGAWVLDGVYD